MNDKYFYFKRSNSGSTNSDIGNTVGVFAVPVSKVSFISTKPSKVVIYFSDVGLYNDVQLSDGEVFQKSYVEVNTTLGDEDKLVSSIIDFITSDKAEKRVMRFDVSGDVSFRDAVITDLHDISAVIPNSPSSTPQRTGKSLPTGPTSFIIEGINYGEENYPFLDFVAATAYITNNATAGTGTVDEWANASQADGASAHVFIPGNVGTPPFFYNDGSRENGGVDGTYIKMSGQQGFVFNTLDFEHTGDYTIFMCLGVSSNQDFPLFRPIYGSDVQTSVDDNKRKCIGPFSPFEPSKVFMRHADKYGAPASASSVEDDGTTSYVFPDNGDPATRQTCYVFVIRRTEFYELVVHNHVGDVVAYIPTNLGSQFADESTSGNLYINGLCSVIDSDIQTVVPKFFDGAIKRFGVIKKDIGASEAANLATTLFELYNPNS